MSDHYSDEEHIPPPSISEALARGDQEGAVMLAYMYGGRACVEMIIEALEKRSDEDFTRSAVLSFLTDEVTELIAETNQVEHELSPQGAIIEVESSDGSAS